MRCPFCAHEDTNVKDSRPAEDGAVIRRRRQCPACQARFTTFERVQLRPLIVTKKNGEQEAFRREKLNQSLVLACRKRPIDSDQIDRIVSGLVRQLESQGEDTIPSTRIGMGVMETLRELDQVAYIRYASVYRDFREAEDFQSAVKALEENTPSSSKPSELPLK